ncbi:hypothetical protein B0H21DRAFT_826765 [Amylocystis lapponica]|nr:hypothetical protein B0H21DRAFT_826765 [Amylocystis lapponica]
MFAHKHTAPAAALSAARAVYIHPQTRARQSIPCPVSWTETYTEKLFYDEQTTLSAFTTYTSTNTGVNWPLATSIAVVAGPTSTATSYYTHSNWEQQQPWPSTCVVPS